MTEKVRIIVKAVPERGEYIDYLRKNLPEAEFCMDEKKDPFDTFIRAFKMAGSDSCVHMEEDVILTKDFYNKLSFIIKQDPFHIIQFFSMRKADVSIGSRWDKNFIANLCTYYPYQYSFFLSEFYDSWIKTPNGVNNPTGTDTMVADWIKRTKQKYWIHVPNLVDHRVGKSIIDPKRGTTNRVSKTFVDPIND